jgi:hypothetical protein
MIKEEETYEKNMELLISLEKELKLKEEEKTIVYDLILELKDKMKYYPNDKYIQDNIKLLQEYIKE